MKVALFSEIYPPLINGVATHVKILRQGLIELGHEVLVVYADPKVKKFTHENGILICPSRPLKKIYGFGLANPFSVRNNKTLLNFAPDVIHIHTEFGIGLAGALAAKKLKIPLVYTMHTMYDEYMHYILPRFLIHPGKSVAHKYARFLGKRASKLIGPSQKVAEYFKACKVKKDVIVMENAVELDDFNLNNIKESDIDNVKDIYNISKDDFVVCFCGRLGHEKSIDVLLKNWAKTVTADDKMKLMIIGAGPVENELKTLVFELKIQDTTIFTGRVEHTDIPPYYAACDMYVTASLSEMNSISMKEAMALGLPALYIADELNLNQINHGENGFIYRTAEDMYKYLIKYRDMEHDKKEALKKSTRDSVAKDAVNDWTKRIVDIYLEAK